MKKSVLLLAGTIAMLGMWSCKEKPQTDDIITKRAPEAPAPKGTQRMSDFTYEKTIEWMNGNYTITIHRYSDDTLPQTQDEQGRKYYDNKIGLKITRAEGSEFLNRVFTKTDFSDFINNSYGRNGALLGLAYDRVDGSNLVFGASVGSPDSMSDEYIPMQVIVSASGSVSIKASSQLDSGNGEEPRDELEAAEAEGM